MNAFGAPFFVACTGLWLCKEIQELHRDKIYPVKPIYFGITHIDTSQNSVYKERRVQLYWSDLFLCPVPTDVLTPSPPYGNMLANVTVNNLINRPFQTLEDVAWCFGQRKDIEH